MKKVHLVSLGCPKNLVDSEIMLGVLGSADYQVVEEPEAADLLLVNTCGFIQDSVEEGVDEILRLAAYKQQDPRKKLVVTGCMVQRYGEKLAAELPEVDLFTGTDEVQQIDQLVSLPTVGETPRFIASTSEARYLMNASVRRGRATPHFRSYLKISEGCDNRCSYCLIPGIRGPLRSRSVADLSQEAARLASEGVQELTLIGQDLTAYGDDLAPEVDLVALLRQLLASSEIGWLRLMYLYPTTLTDELLALMAEQPRIVPYLDIPFQHVSDPVLRRMNRGHGQEDLERLITRIRTYLPDVGLRTTLLVGFPGETEADVETLEDCLQRWQLDHVGIFQYADEPEAPSHHLKDKVEAAEKAARYDRLMQLQAEISAARLQRFVGQVEPVLVEGVSPESELLLAGRTRFQAPDVDGGVYINAGTATAGDIVAVKIEEAHTYDLLGGIVDEEDES